jgi:hypothetical protein
MELVLWQPRVERTKREEFLLKRLGRTRKLFAFLRLHRQEIFDEGFQRELESMYRDSGAGKEPVTPALMVSALTTYGPLFPKTFPPPGPPRAAP